MADDGLNMIHSASDAAFEGPHVHVAVQRPVPGGDRARRTPSALGLGTVKFGRNRNVRYPGGDGFALPSDREIERLLDVAVECGMRTLETLARLKDEGKIGAFGVSTYTVEGGRLALDRCDAVMVAYNRAYTAQRPVIDAACANRKLVLVKKGLASGHVGDLGNVADNIR